MHFPTKRKTEVPQENATANELRAVEKACIHLCEARTR